MGEGNLLMFTGRECKHCKEMDPLVEMLEKKEGIKVEKLEVWHNAENMERLRKLDDGRCGGVPFFFNKKTKKFICGSVSYEELKGWALK